MPTPEDRVRETVPHSVPLVLVSQLAHLVERWHIPVDELLAETGLARGDLDDPMGRFPLPKMCALLARARLLTREPGLGYYHGLQMRASAFGTVGFASQTSASLGDALAMARKFAPLFSTALGLDLRVEEGIATLYLEENADFGDVRDVVVISMMVGLRTIFAALTGAHKEGVVDLAIPEPSYQSRFSHLAPNWRFGRPANRVSFEESALKTPLLTSDPAGLQLTRSLCMRALDELDYDAGLVDCVRRFIIAPDEGFRTLDDVAALLHVSERTLKRRLAAQGVSFSELAERERTRKALALLRRARLPLADIAVRLGYSTESSFVRAFRRWTGITPAVYRRKRKATLQGKRT